SPMAFLVGVAFVRTRGSPPPGAPRSLSPAVGQAEGSSAAGLSDGAPPSPLKGEVHRRRDGEVRPVMRSANAHELSWSGLSRPSIHPLVPGLAAPLTPRANPGVTP